MPNYGRALFRKKSRGSIWQWSTNFSWLYEIGLADFFSWSWNYSMSFLHFLNENVLFFDKENCFSFQISPTFNKLKKKKKVNLKQWKKKRSLNKESYSYICFRDLNLKLPSWLMLSFVLLRLKYAYGVESWVHWGPPSSLLNGGTGNLS